MESADEEKSLEQLEHSYQQLQTFYSVLRNKDNVSYNVVAGRISKLLREYSLKVREIVYSFIGKQPSEIEKKIIKRVELLRKVLAFCKGRDDINYAALAEKASSVELLIKDKLGMVVQHASRVLDGQRNVQQMYIMSSEKIGDLFSINARLRDSQTTERFDEREITRVLPSLKFQSAGQNGFLFVIDKIKEELAVLFNELSDRTDEAYLILLQIDKVIDFCSKNRVNPYLAWIAGNKNSMEYYIKILTELKLIINKIIIRDENKQKQAEGRFIKELESIKTELQESAIEYTNFSLGIINGRVYTRKGENYSGRNAVIIAPGTTSSFRHYEFISYRLVVEGFLVCAFDLPGHGESGGTYNVGLIAETIRQLAAMLREKYGVNKVGAVGHSIGAISTLMSIAGYDRVYENDIMRLIKSLSEKIKRAGNSLTPQLLKKFEAMLTKDLKERSGIKVTKDDFLALQKLLELDEDYELLREIIMTAVQKNVRNAKGMGKIDAAVLMGMPASIQMQQMAPSFLFKMRSFHLMRLTLNAFFNLPAKWGLEFWKSNFIQWEGPKDRDAIYYCFMKIKSKDFIELLDYLDKVPDPFNIISLIYFFSQKFEFVNLYYRVVIVPVPKLFLYGERDILLKPFKGDNKEQLRRGYAMWGSAHLQTYPGISHWMGERSSSGFNKLVRKAQVPKLNDDIVGFMKTYLN